MPEPLTLIIPVRSKDQPSLRVAQEWHNWLSQVKREFTLLVIDDGVHLDIDFNLPHARVLSHDSPQGFGACLRTGLAAATTPLVGHVLPDYPYTPASAAKLLARLETPVDVYGVMRDVDAVSGCRAGLAAPPFWRRVGWCYRTFVRVALGHRPAPLPGWLGLRNHWRSWKYWLTMGVPLTDITCGLKFFRRAVFERFPIQSNGDFAHAEIFAKLTFTGALIAEEPLPAGTAAIPPTDFAEAGKVFKNAKFHNPLAPSNGDGVDHVEVGNLPCQGVEV